MKMNAFLTEKKTFSSILIKCCFGRNISNISNKKKIEKKSLRVLFNTYLTAALTSNLPMSGINKSIFIIIRLMCDCCMVLKAILAQVVQLFA